jgi:hypothetical protein
MLNMTPNELIWGETAKCVMGLFAVLAVLVSFVAAQAITTGCADRRSLPSWPSSPAERRSVSANSRRTGDGLFSRSGCALSIVCDFSGHRPAQVPGIISEESSHDHAENAPPKN